MKHESPTPPARLPTRPRTRALLVAALAASLPGALAVPHGPGDVLRGTIADWPRGERAELRLESERMTFATGTVEPNGDFTLTLPSPAKRDLKLVPVARLFWGPRNEACDGDARAVPSAGAFRFFELVAYQDGRVLGDVQRRSSARHDLAPGEVTTQLVYFDAPLTLTGTLRCRNLTETWNGEVSAGWNLLTAQAGRDGNRHLALRRTSGAVAATQRWLLYSEFGGVGFNMVLQDDRSGVRVERVTEGLPAAKAGLRPGDEIEEIDGEDARAFTTGDVSLRVLGEPGQRLTLLVRRPGQEQPLRFELVRAAVRVP